MTESASRRLRRGDRLRERRDFQRVSRDGVRTNSPSFVVLAAPRRNADRHQNPRLGITASRRVGPAVVRSLVKRRIREWFRQHREDLPVSRDIVVIARSSAATAPWTQIEAELSASAAQLRAAIARSPRG
jgi:ribonuclease P protein component